jgi:SPP1 gp7 family putative phage head morphogenesis protein
MFENLFSPEWWAAQKNILAGLIHPVILRAYHAGLINGNDLLLALFDIVVDLDISNDLVAAAAKQYSFTVAGQIHETTQNYLQETVSSWIASGEPLADLERSLVQSGYFSADRANRIAVTSITEVFADANIAAWKQSGMVSGKRWNTAQDDLVCPICEPLAGMVVALDANGFTTEGDFGLWAPPAHVRCRCWLQPVVEETAE